uniref:Uncharacterized protein n=1 Tax=Mycena chlorophos TaxID=658473 RepID=A0ABQ0KXX4_MYCCL|nr:predicted protein [Mycena chlorophos]
MPSKHTRKIDHPAPLPPAQRAAMIRRLATVDAAIRAGRVKVVNPPQNCAFKPRMEIYDDPEASHIFATLELPGVKTTDFGIAFKPGALELTGVRPARLPMHTQDRPPYASQHEDMDVDSGNTSGSYERASSLFPLHELRYGTFNRTIPLPDGVDIVFCLPAWKLCGGLTQRGTPHDILAPRNHNRACDSYGDESGCCCCYPRSRAYHWGSAPYVLHPWRSGGTYRTCEWTLDTLADPASGLTKPNSAGLPLLLVDERLHLSIVTPFPLVVLDLTYGESSACWIYTVQHLPACRVSVS